MSLHASCNNVENVFHRTLTNSSVPFLLYPNGIMTSIVPYNLKPHSLACPQTVPKWLGTQRVAYHPPSSTNNPANVATLLLKRLENSFQLGTYAVTELGLMIAMAEK